MDFNHLFDSKSTSEENDRSEQSNDEMGTGRSYECVFCKRGFTTAQALGGHMNIHRKDRAKSSSRPSSFPVISTNKIDGENYASNFSRSYYYPPIQNFQPYYSLVPAELHVSYQAVFPSSSWPGFNRPPHTHHFNDELFVNKNNSQHVNNIPFGKDQDWPKSLSLGIGPSHVDENGKTNHGSCQEDDQLDLELRLGHDP